MKTLFRKNSDWSIKLHKDPSRKSLMITASKKDLVEFVFHKFPNITFTLPREKFLEHFEPHVGEK